MKSRSPFCLVLFSAAVLLFSANAARAQFFGFIPFEAIPTIERPQPVNLEYRVFSLINQIRAEHGLKPISWDDQAATVARVHSADMATRDYFSHVDPEGRSIGERADQVGLKKWRTIGENIAYNAGSADPAARAVRAWMNSDAHRDNILLRKWKQTGIGVTVSPTGRYYFTQVFLKRR